MRNFKQYLVEENEPKVLFTYKGSQVSRHLNIVGKKMGTDLYVHHDYADHVIPKDIIKKANDILRNSQYYEFKYSCIKFTPSLGVFRVDASPDFDTAREPHTGDSINIYYNKGIVKPNPPHQGTSIWHHKWIWVMDDYKGFNVEESYQWSKLWLSRFKETAIGRDKIWNLQLRKYGLGSEVQEESWKSAIASGLAAASLFASSPDAEGASKSKVKPSTTQTQGPNLKQKEITEDQFKVIKKNISSYNYINKRYQSQENLSTNLPIVLQVAKEYKLNDIQKKTLLSMRILENGRRGCEFGVDDYNIKSPSRRYAPERVGINVKTPAGQAEWDKKYRDLSLKVQAQYAAGTIKKRMPIDNRGKPNIAALAYRYCPENWKLWADKTIKFLQTS